ncbi:hypothetical protein KY284_007466 [Solanum tuberosum]|nr:hypothetical protein KY284_007466 [Solanum tuberosum]
MSPDSSVSSWSTMNCQCGIARRIFTGYKCDYWKWVDDTLHPRVANLIHNINKENDNLHSEKKALETRMTDLEKCLTSDIEENCERLDEITKSEEAVVDNEEVDIDKFKKNEQL